ncbi:hypothetical protein COO60DRAFT_459029 [Scenedesmus sp. NREL 46B-D3]|nr:hypothetical protein COO60DRAFT_459029 [Scenedesmus sp. NREL 46B-D3]
MHIIINCTGGGSHSMMLLESTTVLELKQHIERKEGVSVHQQLLLFAGQVLCPDSALLLGNLGLDRFSLAHEVVVYMQRQLAEPVLVNLCQPGSAPCQMHPQIVEARSSLANVMALLQQHKLAGRPFPVAAGAGVKSKTAGERRHESAGVGAPHSAGMSLGSASSSVTELQVVIHQVEGAAPTHLSFYQAQDGCLHVVWGPSTDSSSNSHTVYSRSSMPQTTMLLQAKDAGSQCFPLSTLVKKQAVMP